MDAGAVVVSSELRMLDESIPAHEIQKVLLGRVVVFATMLLARPWGPGSICKEIIVLADELKIAIASYEKGRHTRNRESKSIRDFIKKSLEQGRLSGSRRAGYYHWTELLDCRYDIVSLIVSFWQRDFLPSNVKSPRGRWESRTSAGGHCCSWIARIRSQSSSEDRVGCARAQQTIH